MFLYRTCLPPVVYFFGNMIGYNCFGTPLTGFQKIGKHKDADRMVIRL